MMSTLTLLDENAERVPDLDLAQQKFLLTLPEFHTDVEIKNNVMNTIRTRNMAPWYETICVELEWDCDLELLEQMKANNEESLKCLNEDIEAAQANLSTSEVKEAFLRKAEYLSIIGDKNNAIKVLGQAFAVTVAAGCKLDNVFACIRIGFFFIDHELIKTNLERAKDLALLGLDYDRKNRLGIYQGFYGLATRDFKITTSNFLQTINTFTCRELMDYSTFIRYAVVMSAFTLTRPELKKKVIDSSDILQTLHEIPDVQKYVFSLYNCQYADFFQSLAEMEQILRQDYMLNPHYRFYVREMKIKAYSQFLVSYQTITFAYMAEQFGVTEDFMEDELSRLIAAGELYGKIDKVKKILLVSRGTMEKRNEQFSNVIRHGDLLLNRIHNLARFVDSRN